MDMKQRFGLDLLCEDSTDAVECVLRKRHGEDGILEESLQHGAGQDPEGVWVQDDGS